MPFSAFRMPLRENAKRLCQMYRFRYVYIYLLDTTKNHYGETIQQIVAGELRNVLVSCRLWEVLRPPQRPHHVVQRQKIQICSRI